MNAFRVYAPEECGPDGYPRAWHDLGEPLPGGIKHAVRALAGHRCVRCGHPYYGGAGEWSLCDQMCTHRGPVRVFGEFGDPGLVLDDCDVAAEIDGGFNVHAQWRILTVHHLRLGDHAKRDLRWWNLAALCQRCHLSVQSRVVMERIWPWPHSEWFKPYAAGWYAWAYLGADLTRAEVEARLDELLALELVT